MSTLLTILAGNTLLAALLAALAWGAYRWGRSPAISHVFWMLALVKLITPPLAPVQVGWKFQPEKLFVEPVASGRSALATSGVPRVAQTSGDRTTSLTGGTNTAAASSSRIPFKQLRIPCTWATFTLIAGGVWFAGSVLVALRIAGRAWAFHGLLERCQSPDGELSRRAWRLARRAGLATAPRVVLVEALLSPMLWGVGRRTRLIFPAILKERLDDDETDSLLLHELGHYARGDHWVRLLELVCRVALWWHPLVWLACRQLEEVEEHCCDAWVVARQAGRERSYAEALLATIDFLNEHPVLAPPLASGLGDAQLLRRRLTQIMAGDGHPAQSRLATRLAWGWGLTLVLLHPALGASSVPRTAVLAPNSGRLPFSSTSNEPPPRPSAARVRPAPPRPTNSPWTPPLADFPWTPPQLIATAESPNREFRLEARAGRRTKLVDVLRSKQIDLSSNGFTCTAFAPDGQTFFSGDEDGIIRQWNCHNGEMLDFWKGHLKEVTSLHVSPDGTHLASGSLDGLMKIWPIKDRSDAVASVQRERDGISCVRWSADGNKVAIAVGGWSDSEFPELVVFDFEKRIAQPGLQLDRPVGTVAWFKDSLLAAGWDGQAIIVDTVTGSAEPASVHKDDVSAAAWSAQCPLRLLLPEEEI